MARERTMRSLLGVFSVVALSLAVPVATSYGASAATPVTRLAGSTRIGTAIAVSQASFPAAGSASAAVLANDANFADALSGTPLALAKGGPLLVTGTDGLDPNVAAELQRTLRPGAPVQLLGGVAALNEAVSDSGHRSRVHGSAGERA